MLFLTQLRKQNLITPSYENLKESQDEVGFMSYLHKETLQKYTNIITVVFTHNVSEPFIFMLNFLNCKIIFI